MLVEVDPAAATRALVGERVCGHEVVRGLHADADVDLLSPVGQLDLLPELRVLRVVLAVVELLQRRFGGLLKGSKGLKEGSV